MAGGDTPFFRVERVRDYLLDGNDVRMVFERWSQAGGCYVQTVELSVPMSLLLDCHRRAAQVVREWGDRDAVVALRQVDS